MNARNNVSEELIARGLTAEVLKSFAGSYGLSALVYENGRLRFRFDLCYPELMLIVEYDGRRERVTSSSEQDLTNGIIKVVSGEQRIEKQHAAGKLTADEASAAKLWHTDLQWEVCDAALQLHGGAGYMNEYLIARLWRDARVTRIFGGTNEIMKEVVAREI
mgnify:CR=1 FL=1